MSDYRQALMEMGAYQMATDRKRIKALETALANISEAIDGMADVEDRPDGAGVRPNIFMRIEDICYQALRR